MTVQRSPRAPRRSTIAAGLLLLLAQGCGTEEEPVEKTDAADDAALIEPGRYGPLEVGMDGDDAVATGLAVGPDLQAMCERFYAEAAGPLAKGLALEFDNKEPYALQMAGVTPFGMGDVEPTYPVHTAEGLEIGSPVEDVAEHYGHDAVFASFPAEGDRYGSYVVFDGGGGALQIMVDSADESSATEVIGLLATSGTSLDDVNALFGGC